MTSISKLISLGVTGLPLSSSPRLDAELILQHVTGLTREKLHTHPEKEISQEEESKYLALLARRAKCEPVAYLTGFKEFWGLNISVSPVVLIPRPETELLVERALKILEEKESALTILDLGTGSGAIAIALASELKRLGRKFSIVAIDSSDTALEVARQNCKTLGCGSEILLKKSDWYSVLSPSQDQFDLIVSNPPYIADNDSAISPELKFEPSAALFSGEQGLDAIVKILGGVRIFLKPGGKLLVEMGHNQRQPVSNLCKELLSPDAYSLIFHLDLAGLDRAFEVGI